MKKLPLSLTYFLSLSFTTAFSLLQQAALPASAEEALVLLQQPSFDASALLAHLVLSQLAADEQPDFVAFASFVDASFFGSSSFKNANSDVAAFTCWILLTVTKAVPRKRAKLSTNNIFFMI